MIRVLLFLAVVVVLALGGTWLAERPGEVDVIWQGYRIETSLVVLLAVVVALALVIMLLWAVVRFVLRLPAMMTLASRARRRSRGYMAVSRGMVAVGAGDPAAARRHAHDAERWLGREPLTLLLKAQAAQISGDRGQAEATFNEMLDERETRVLGLRGLFVEARRKGDAAAARAYAEKAVELAPAVGWANEAMLEFQSVERDWRGAIATLERRVAYRSIDRAVARRHRAVLLTADAIDRAEKDPDGALSAARTAVKLAPDLVPAAVLAGRLLVRMNSPRKAAKMLEASWKLMPHPDTAAAYLDLRPGDSARDRLARAETLARLAPDHPETRLTLAQAALDAREFQRAREALAPLLVERPVVRACLLMADLEEAEHGATGAMREWLGRASRAPRDSVWIADGVVSERWEPVSPATGRLDAFVWATPAEHLAPPRPRPEGEGEEKPALESPAPAAAAAPAEPSPPASTGVAAATGEAVEEKPATEGKDEPADERRDEPTPEARPVGNGPAAQARPQPGFVAPVVFPVPHAPDDPGPDEDAAKPSRFTLLG